MAFWEKKQFGFLYIPKFLLFIAFVRKKSRKLESPKSAPSTPFSGTSRPKNLQLNPLRLNRASNPPPLRKFRKLKGGRKALRLSLNRTLSHQHLAVELLEWILHYIIENTNPGNRISMVNVPFLDQIPKIKSGIWHIWIKTLLQRERKNWMLYS